MDVIRKITDLHESSHRHRLTCVTQAIHAQRMFAAYLGLAGCQDGAGQPIRVLAKICHANALLAIKLSTM